MSHHLCGRLQVAVKNFDHIFGDGICNSVPGARFGSESEQTSQPRKAKQHTRMILNSRKKRLRAPALPLYEEPPAEEVPLDLFEQCGFARLQLLKAVATPGFQDPTVDLNTAIAAKFNRFIAEIKHAHRPFGNDPLSVDVLSHFVLRLAFAAKEDTRNWFVDQEARLHSARFSLLGEDKSREWERMGN